MPKLQGVNTEPVSWQQVQQSSILADSAGLRCPLDSFCLHSQCHCFRESNKVWLISRDMTYCSSINLDVSAIAIRSLLNNDCLCINNLNSKQKSLYPWHASGLLFHDQGLPHGKAMGMACQRTGWHNDTKQTFHHFTLHAHWILLQFASRRGLPGLAVTPKRPFCGTEVDGGVQSRTISESPQVVVESYEQALQSRPPDASKRKSSLRKPQKCRPTDMKVTLSFKLCQLYTYARSVIRIEYKWSIADRLVPA